MPRVAQKGLSHHATKGFRISIGKKPDGNYRTFWLGKDRVVAEYHADTLKGQFSHMQTDGRSVWDENDEKAVRWYVDQFRSAMSAVKRQHLADVAGVQEQGKRLEAFFGPPVPAAAATRPADAPATAPRLYATIASYLEAFKSKVLSAAHKERTRQLLEDLKHFRPDIALSTIDRVWLQTLTDHIKSRPNARKRGTPLAPLTVRNTLRAWSRFFDWIDSNADSERFGRWQAPRRWEDLFRVRLTKLMSKTERDAYADGPKQLTVDQVVRLYRAAKNDTHRVCILLGTFAALGQQEIATLRRDEFNLQTGILTHRRSKTGQLGKFWLPPELVKMIRRYFRDNRTDSEGTAFFSADGQRLVTDSSDSVRQAWTDIVNRVNKEKGQKIQKGMQGFYHLRKFAADFAMQNGGPDVRDTFLAHAPESVGAKFYSNNRDFTAVFGVGKKMHQTMLIAKMFSSTPNEAAA